MGVKSSTWLSNEKWHVCMKVGSLLYENTCSEWLHVVYSKYERLELADPSSLTIVAISSPRVKLWQKFANLLLLCKVPSKKRLSERCRKHSSLVSVCTVCLGKSLQVSRVYMANYRKYQGPVVQSIVSLISSLVVKMLTVLVITISNSQVLLLKKCE